MATIGVQDVKIVPTPVPTSVGDKLGRLFDRVDLDFAAADFMTDEDGELQFLEVNSQPMFAAFARVDDGEVCDAIINYLVSCEEPCFVGRLVARSC